MFRMLPNILFAGALLIAVDGARAADPAPPPAPPAPPESGLSEEEEARRSLDKLFDRLAAAEDEDEASGIARLIQQRWLRSGSATADLLMSRAVASLAGGDQALAVELLDRVLALEPDWAEAWNKRAVVFTMLGDEERAILDLRRAVTLEPRHFVAWTGLGTLFRKAGDKKGALEAFRRALAIDPQLTDVKETVDRLRIEVEGRDL